MIMVFVSYLQYLMLRLELFIDESTLQAYMTPQVCYIEKMLQMHISPLARIDPEYTEFILWREDDPEGVDVFISDSEDVMIYDDSMFGFETFTIVLPYGVEALENYARELTDRYKLPGVGYTIIYR
jgi:hypothetical protein